MNSPFFASPVLSLVAINLSECFITLAKEILMEIFMYFREKVERVLIIFFTILDDFTLRLSLLKIA